MTYTSSPPAPGSEPASRRSFIRVLAGGAIFAAGTLATGAGLQGCSSEIPADAVLAWKGPAAGETDVRRWMLSYALLAPHSHNLQSWLVDLKEPGVITLYCDTTRLLPETDPQNRQIMMSQGTFLELLSIAARERSHRAEITLFPLGVFEGDKPDATKPIARITLTPDPSLKGEPLFAAILKRHTHRGLYDLSRAVPAEAFTAMAQAAADIGVAGMRFGHLGNADVAALERHRAIAREAWRIELTTPHTMLESLKVLRVGAAEVRQHRDGISLMDPMVVALTKLGLFDRSKAPAADDPSVTGQIKDFDANMKSTPAFLWFTTAANDRLTQVNAGRAYARVQLAGTLQGVVMQPLQQALQEYKEVAAPYRAARQLMAPEGGTVQMWARVGFAAASGRHGGPAPRRGLDAIIRA